MPASIESFWRRCSSCKREIAFDAAHWTCSVSSCNRKGSSFVFCSVACWDAHVPTMRHREAWAEEARSPTKAAWASGGDNERKAAPEAPRAAAAAGAASPQADHAAPAADDDGETVRLSTDDIPQDVLIVASKLKAYVRARGSMSTSETVMKELSKLVRRLCDDAILRAHAEGRKTLMDRDF